MVGALLQNKITATGCLARFLPGGSQSIRRRPAMARSRNRFSCSHAGSYVKEGAEQSVRFQVLPLFVGRHRIAKSMRSAILFASSSRGSSSEGPFDEALEALPAV